MNTPTMDTPATPAPAPAGIPWYGLETLAKLARYDGAVAVTGFDLTTTTVGAGTATSGTISISGCHGGTGLVTLTGSWWAMRVEMTGPGGTRFTGTYTSARGWRVKVARWGFEDEQDAVAVGVTTPV